MLLELRVENYAVIDNVAVEFGPGLNLLTGETGAGKSILIDALALLLGEKASTDVVRHGADKAVISAVIEFEGTRIPSVLQEHGIDCDGTELILRREIGAKGRVFLNNQPATVALLKELAPELASVHAQSESIVGFDAAARLELLDLYAGVDTADAAEAFRRWRAIRERIADLERSEQDRMRLVDLWSFQKKEIESAKLEIGEDERLESEKRVLANAEKIHAAAMGAYESLYESDASAATLMRSAVRQIEELARYDGKFQEIVSSLESARATVEDVSVTLRDYAGGIDASPERLAEIEDRLALLDRLKRKYGQSLEEVLAFGAEAARKLNEVENRDQVLAELRRELAEAARHYLTTARSISRKRYEAARKLEKLVETAANELAMKARFRIEVSGSDEEGNWSASGFDQVAYLISTNPGEPLQPIERIASGGELSRVLLALKATVETATVGKRRGKVQRTLVFDEIDNGIGGRAAEAVGKKLKSLARSNQVLCITHLPQIAAFADLHLLIQKKEAQGRVRTSVRRLTAEERTDELARMLSGAKLTETSRKHAEQLLKANA
ncbi:MAG TPA: DNA repair protein RecN [Terriglobales bacterium]|nr:DNA repair protein RecN [Terriglobales bacterium]